MLLAIESSCDDSAIAIFDDRSNLIYDHCITLEEASKKFGGIVPEIAARAHGRVLPLMLRDALKILKININEITSIAATAGPGLIGGIIVGQSFAKSLAWFLKIPYFAIHHIIAHALSAELSIKNLRPPYLCAVLTGGHAEIIEIKNYKTYQNIGRSIDDAPGECFDKIARLLGLGFPGGPAIEAWAKNGNALKYNLPKPFYNINSHCNFSFSGLKAATRRLIDSLEKPRTNQQISDICASFQYAITNSITNRLESALKMQNFRNEQNVKKPILVVAGGVAANSVLRESILKIADKHNFEIFFPQLKYCTDNAAMIGLTALKIRQYKNKGDKLNFKAMPRWPVENWLSYQ